MDFVDYDFKESIDYNLNIHYEGDEDANIHQHGYTIRFNTDTIIDYVKEKYGIIAEKGIRYRFVDDDLFKELRDNLSTKESHFSGLFGDDGWALYQYKFDHIDYWKSIYGDDYFEKNYPEIGIEIWNNSKDLIIEK